MSWVPGVIAAACLFGAPASWHPSTQIIETGRMRISAPRAHLAAFNFKASNLKEEVGFRVAKKAIKATRHRQDAWVDADLVGSAPVRHLPIFSFAHRLFPSELIDRTFSLRGPPSVSL